MATDTTPTQIATFLAAHGVLVRVLGASKLRVRRDGGRQLVLSFLPGWNLADIRVTVQSGAWDPKRPSEWLEEVHGRHTIGGEAVDIGCLGHSCLNAINANSFPAA